MKLSEKLFVKAFFPGRPERSRFYKHGVLSALSRHTEGHPIEEHGYAQGSAEFDAYYAGIDEGNRIWREYAAEQRGE